MKSTKTQQPRRIETKRGSGIEGLDEIMCGGFPSNRLYLIQGHPNWIDTAGPKSPRKSI